jgi:ribosomal protein S18 acetylase RimI-like enzyme
MIQVPSIRLLSSIGNREYGEIGALEALCRERGGAALKLELDFKLASAGTGAGGLRDINEFLYYGGDAMIGYLGICGFGGGMLELNGMTRPDCRRMGVFARLYDLAADECRRRGAQRVLLLCDRASAEGRRFVEKTGAALHHSELEMLLDADAPAGAGGRAVTLRKAPGEEADGSEAYLAEVGGVTVGRVRLETVGGCGGIYGLAVQSEYRGRGYGRGILMRSVEKLREGGAGSIRLQVDEENGPARHIYESSGFRTVYIMDYYSVEPQQMK